MSKKQANKQRFAAQQRHKRKAFQRAMNGLLDRAREVFAKGMSLDMACKVLVDYCCEIAPPDRTALSVVATEYHHEGRLMRVYMQTVAQKVED